MLKMLSFGLYCTVLALFCGCGEDSSAKAGTPDQKTAAVSRVCAGIPPVAFLAERIMGEPVQTVLPDGQNPRDYNPSPADVRRIARSQIFLTAGMPFEQKMISGLQNSPVRIADATAGVKRIPLEDHGGHEAEAEEGEHHHHHHHYAGELDPHVWMDPANCKAIAANILQQLVLLAPLKAALFRKNYQELIQALDAVNAENRKLLAPYQGRAFLVHHAAFGYFAQAYGLKQMSIELGGREPSPARLAEVIRVAREHHIRCIFIQPQFNPSAAQTLAKAIGGTAEPLDPLQGDVLASLRRIGQVIAKGFAAK